MLTKVISGGQTGVDTAALRAAARAGIATGGWCPQGWRTETGSALWLERFGLREMPTTSYQARTRRNVAESDGTLILAMKPDLTGGTALTRSSCLRSGKPLHVIDLSNGETLAESSPAVTAWIRKFHVQTLNVAGPRESECPGIGTLAEAFLTTIFESIS